MTLVTKRSDIADKPSTATELQVYCCELTNLDFLVNYPRVTKLKLCGLQLTDLSALQYTPQLACLRVWKLPQLTDFDGLKYVPQLTRLILWELPQLPNLNILQYTPYLTILKLYSLAQLTNLDDLQHTPQLTKLITSKLPRLTNLEGLQHTPQLATLQFYRVPPLIEIPRLPMLERLIIDEPMISNGTVIPFIRSLTHYQRIWSQAKRACP